jgi:hypothetical protein
VFNPARLCKFYGTMARKGPNTPDRPHRQSAIIEAPEELEPVTRHLLEDLAKKAQVEPERVVAAPRNSESNGNRLDDPEQVPIDERTQRAKAYLAKVPPARSSRPADENGGNYRHGHDQTFFAACRLVLDFDLSPEEAYPLLAEWNDRCDPPWDPKDLWHKLADADKKGGPRGKLLQKFADTDLGNARRFAAEHGNDLRYVGAWGKWLVWDGSRWLPDELGLLN